MSVDKSIKSLAITLGCDFFGIADLKIAQDFIEEQGGKIIGHHPYAISIGIGLVHSIVNLLPKRANMDVAKSYRFHCYDIINQRLDLITSRLCGELQKQGYEAFPVPASQTSDHKQLRGLFSHKLAAHLAGLGWIGKSCLLVTHEAGPRLRLASILTNAPFKHQGNPMESQCGSCHECFRNCPARAITGKNFNHADAREVRYDAHGCEKYHDALKERYGVAACGMCIYSCPHGRKRGIRL